MEIAAKRAKIDWNKTAPDMDVNRLWQNALDVNLDQFF